MDQIGWTLGVILLPACCTAFGAACVFLMNCSTVARQRMLSGLAAGIMLAASVWSLLLPSIERSRGQGLPAWLPPAAGLLCAAVGELRNGFAGNSLPPWGRGGKRTVQRAERHDTSA